MSQAAGWYYADGDPPGTHRYWDGAQWQGGPQPVSAAVGGARSVTGATNATLGSRFVAALIDAGIGLVIAAIGTVLLVIGFVINEAVGLLFLFVVFVATWAFAAYNIVYLQGTTGQTLGKKQQGIMLVSKETGQPLGIGMALVRYLFSGLLASICGLDIWWILLDENNQRLSDNILNNHVVAA